MVSESVLVTEYEPSELEASFEKTKKEEVKVDTTTDELFGLSDESSSYDLLKVFFQQAIPVVLSFLLDFSGGLTNLYFAGQYSQIHNNNAIFAGVGLAVMFTNVSGLSLLIGMSTAVETLGSQNNGAGNYKEVGIVLQRSCLVLSTFILPMFILWQYTYDIFSSLGIDHSVCKVIQTYASIRFLSIPCDIVNESYEKYLMSIGVIQPGVFSGICFNLCLIVLNYCFLHIMHYEFECVAWSWVISVYFSTIVRIATSLFYPAVQRTLQPFDTAALTKWYEFIELGLPGTAMLCSEWWAYEILTMFASLLGTTDTAAQTIIMQIVSLSFMIPLGVGVTSASLVGNSLGAGKTPLAIRIEKTGLFLIVVLEIIVGITIFFGGNTFIRVFTKDLEVIRVAESVILFLTFFEMLDGLQGVCAGILRGTGKQFIGAIANVVAFYGIGLPMAWVFSFNLSLGVKGLIMGLGCGTFFQVLVVMSLIFCKQKYVFSSDLVKEQKYEMVKTNSNNDDNEDDNINC